MTTQEALQRYEVTTASVPCSRSNGLWSALVATLASRSAAGSGLVGSTRPGQPISAGATGGGMFSYESTDGSPDGPPTAA
jgi:hypothetical protein